MYSEKLIRVFENATPTDLRIGRSWYPDAWDISVGMARGYGFPAQNVAAAIAALSPMLRWDLNVEYARKLVRAVRDGEDPMLPVFRSNLRKAVDAQTPLPAIEMTETARSWLIWRKALAPHFRSLSEPEAWALQAARNGASFPAICEGLCEWIAPEEAAGAAAGFLRTWVDDQLISGIRT